MFLSLSKLNQKLNQYASIHRSLANSTSPSPCFGWILGIWFCSPVHPPLFFKNPGIVYFAFPVYFGDWNGGLFSGAG